MIVYNNVKKALGLDQARYLIYGSAPLNENIKHYFLTLNMCLINIYGMSESSGPETLSDPKKFDSFDSHFLKNAG